MGYMSVINCVVQVLDFAQNYSFRMRCRVPTMGIPKFLCTRSFVITIVTSATK